MEQDSHSQTSTYPKTSPLVIPRSNHPISRSMIDEEALKVLYRLYRHGFSAYLVGGSVRDLLLGKVPKDFDVATNAHPHEINALFKNSRIIGRRFRLAHIFFKGRKVVEVSTFRSHSEFEEVETEEGTVIRKDSFGTPDEDAFRRDITINGLFYNVADFSIIDYVGGMVDLERRIIRTIGDPDERFSQDPVRMIRVIRHAARTGFAIEDQTYQAIFRHREEIQKCSPSRVRDEFLRDLKEGAAQPSLKLMLETGLLFSLFPEMRRALGDRNPLRMKEKELFLSHFGLVDQLAKRERPVSESILIALFVIPLLRTTPEHPFLDEKVKETYLAETIRMVVQQLLTPFSFPKHVREMASQILVAQSYLRKAAQRGGVPKKLKLKKYFQEALLLFGIKAEAIGEKVPVPLRYAATTDFLPWWSREFEAPRPRREVLKQRPHKRRRRRHSNRSFLLHQRVGKERSDPRQKKE